MPGAWTSRAAAPPASTCWCCAGSARGATPATRSFYSPLRCAGRLYPQGQKIPFTITVRITQASQVGAVAIATRINATYRNRTRINLTPCVGVLGHDSARYHGQLTPLP